MTDEDDDPLTERLPRQTGLLHWMFEGGIALKGMMGVVEATLGVALLAIGPARVHAWIMLAAEWELVARPNSRLIHWLAETASEMSIETEHFYAVYLLLHGTMKLVMVALLWWRFRFAYPIAVAIQAGFVAFEIHEWTFTHSPVLLGLAVIDAAIMVLIWHEWHHAARRQREAEAAAG